MLDDRARMEATKKEKVEQILTAEMMKHK
nr:hexokinase (EC 2.7.1.1), pancreatic - rat (fragments) [Rattus norvegicus]